ncbi:dihydrofolate reductase family protein [Inhella proteolytica]|uniref:Dihydrofolate reductase family protein n=1 Tax=Inhella proteolytica TaxID=2795029 RepID=A0A931NIX4_9BURK|nr:dihydrofolate reductase family protein [Inhella proteolytica]MBH9579318.1 dihydrofolate reductase family protein [Inhella proteolytica]
MTQIRVDCYSISADGFGAGPAQSLEHPLGRGGTQLHEWVFPTRAFRTRVLGLAGGETGVDDGFAARGFENLGAWILGRNMFGPLRGPWPDESWRGWWGDSPPYGVPVFVLTHHARPSLEMQGGTVFHFVTAGFEAALQQARAAAAGRDVRIGGGAATLRQALQAGSIDRLHIAQSPVLVGQGEPLWAGLDLPALGYRMTEVVPGERATHLRIERG